jgi:dTDP-4-amino-4,6-dideoxygalactose transaminase
MPEIMELANKHGIAVIADAAQAHGATIHGEPVGNFGTICAWSFYPGKNLGAFADAGAITTNSVDLAGSIRRLRNYGSEEKYVHPDLGTNSRLDELQAAFLNVKLQYLESWNARRNDIAHTYLRELTSLDVCLPVIPAGKTSSWHLFVIRVERRDELQAHLRQCGIDTLIHYPIPNHLQDAFQYLDLYEGSFPVAEELSKHVLSIPIGPHMTNVQVDQTVSALHQFSW